MTPARTAICFKTSPLATTENNPEILSSGAGLAAAIAIESGPELGESKRPVRARGYWEQVWIRFRKDKLAIVGGLFIFFLILAAFVGAPLAAHFLGHGPERPVHARRRREDVPCPSAR